MRQLKCQELSGSMAEQRTVAAGGVNLSLALATGQEKAGSAASIPRTWGLGGVLCFFHCVLVTDWNKSTHPVNWSKLLWSETLQCIFALPHTTAPHPLWWVKNATFFLHLQGKNIPERSYFLFTRVLKNKVMFCLGCAVCFLVCWH